MKENNQIIIQISLKINKVEIKKSKNNQSQLISKMMIVIIANSKTTPRKIRKKLTLKLKIIQIKLIRINKQQMKKDYML